MRDRDTAYVLTRQPPSRLHSGYGVIGAGLLLAVFVCLLYYQLLFTNRVLATGDILLYFYPYRDYAAAVLRAGRLPLWNPYIFLGAPFLANPQAAALYPLHWPLSWLPVTKQIYWSAAIHTWLLGMGGFLLLRRWGGSLWASLVAGLVLAGSGFYGGLLGHINQMNGAAWLPWAVLVLESASLSQPSESGSVQSSETRLSDSSTTRLPVADLLFLSALLALLVALMLLAGHTQTVYINLFGLGIWTIWPLFTLRRGLSWQMRVREATPRLAVYTLGVGLGVFISSAQLLPALELSRLGLRSGGLSYAEASSFSLKPLHLPWSLLPSYGLTDLSVVFNTLGYTEFVAYVGLSGLLLAAAGAWRGRGRPRAFGLLFVGLGFFLAMGRWNPVYYLLYTLIPGFDLFRAPARWMMLYTLGMAVLAGLGIDVLIKMVIDRPVVPVTAARRSRSSDTRATPDGILPSAIPDAQRATKAAQRATKAAQQAKRAIKVTLVLLVGMELLLAAQSLPHTQPTAPQAVYDVRSAPAHLLSDPAGASLHPAAAGRFLSMSTITFDPGDMEDYRRIFLEAEPAQLDERAFDQLVIALKAQEILAPNLALLWRVPGIDGFDGGVLPLQRTIDFLSLFVPPDELVPDGRLREQIDTVPDTGLLSLLNIKHVITDKVRDLWYEGVYYDRQIGAKLDPDLPQVNVEAPYPFEATHIGLIGYIEGSANAQRARPAQNWTVAELVVTQSETILDRFALTAGSLAGAHFADDTLDSPMAEASGADVAFRDVEGGRQEYLVKLALNRPTAPDNLQLTWHEGGPDLVIQAVTLIDERTGMFLALLPSDRGRFQLVHSGDVKIYENLDNLPRAYLVHDVIPTDSPQEALEAMRTRTFDPDITAVVEGTPAVAPVQPGRDTVEILSYQPEEVVLRTMSDQPALLVLSDAAYPGWTATVDGHEKPIYATNYLFRGVEIPSGDHTVVFRFRPHSWQCGAWASAAGLLVWTGFLLLWLIWRFRLRSGPGV